MNHSFVCGITFALAVWCWSTDDAIAQRIFGHHDHHRFHGVHDCGINVFVWEQFTEVPILERWWLTPSPIRIAQPIEVVPFAPVFGQPVAPARIQDGGENFARKEMIPGDRFLGQAGQLRVDTFNDPGEIRRRAAILKPSSPAGRVRADRLISSGDQAFAEQNLARATARYREAIAKAPDYAEAHFRLAHAYVATRRYNLALKSALVALELAGTSRRDGFSLEDMYQGDQFPREQHLKRLVDASLREPTDGGLQFLIGFTLHFDAQTELAQDHFRDAQDLDGIHRAYLRYFLPEKPLAEPAEAAN